MALPVAVADTSVLVNLHFLNLLQSLSLFYSKVLIPVAVRAEFLRDSEKGERGVALDLFTHRGFFESCNDFDSIDVGLYHSLKMLGAEAEALSQLKLRNADVLLIDERIGRTIAKREQRVVCGTARILAELEIIGIVNARNCAQRLRDQSGFFISEKIVESALEEARKSRK